MPDTVVDTTVLVSAFLRPSIGGASFDLLQLASALSKLVIPDGCVSVRSGTYRETGRDSKVERELLSSASPLSPWVPDSRFAASGMTSIF